MVIKFDSSGFFESSGNASAEFGEKLRDGIVSHACNIWSSYPGFVTGGKNPISSFARGYMNQACAPTGNPPPAIVPPVTGGQCPGVQYEVEVEYTLGSGNPNRTRSTIVWGEVGRAESRSSQGGGAISIGVLAGTEFDPDANQFYEIDIYAASAGQPDYVRILSIQRVDGQPDECGDRPPEYPPAPPPTQENLSTTINITNLDGIDTTFDLVWNQGDANFNFPMMFKLNGSNVTFDAGGITIFGNGVTNNFSDGGGSPPPGSDGGKTVDNVEYVDLYEETTYMTVNEIVQQQLQDDVIDYVVCESGAIEIIENVVQLPPGQGLLFKLLIQILGDIVRELCDTDATEIGFPEIYPVLPGVDRDVIMFYFKEVIDGKKQPSTYVSTLPNPSFEAILELNSVNVPARQLGKTIKSVKLSDGSRIVARGVDEEEAQSYFDFLIARTDSTLVPSDLETSIVTTVNERLQEISVQCVQIEYYPDGKSFGRTASEIRIIPVV